MLSEKSLYTELVFPCLLWKQNIHYFVHKEPAQWILSQARWIQFTPSSCSWYILKPPSQPSLGLWSGLFSSGFPTVPCEFLFSPIHVPPMIFSFIWSPNTLVKSTNHKAPRTNFSNILLLPLSLSLKYKYSPQFPVLKYPPSTVSFEDDTMFLTLTT